MATTQNTYTGNNSTTEYSFTFPYLEESDVKVSLDGVVQATTEYSFANATTISFNTAPGTDVAIRIFRETDTDSARTTFFAGSAIRAQDLNDNNNQLLYSTQETINRRVDSTGDTMTGDLTLNNADLVFEGATEDAFETTLTVVDPTADRTITLPNVTGTVVTTGDTGTVATAMIAADAVNGTKIADDSIDSEHYVDASIDTAHIADLQITTAKIAGDAVTNAKIADDSIDSEHYVDGSIDTAHIADLQVTTAKLAADAVTNAKIADDSIDSEHYVDGSIDTAHIADSQVTTAKIADANVTTAKITDANVTTAKLADSSVTTAKIANSNVTTAKIADANVTTAKIAADAIDGTKLADNAVDSEHYTDGSIDRVHLAADIVDGTKIADDSIDSEHYVDQSIDAAHLATDSVTTGKINADAITNAKIADNAVQQENINGLTATITELNQLDGNTLSNSSVDWTSGTTFPSASQISARLEAFGGFEAIADDESFPNTAPAEGVIISIANAGGLTVNASGTSTNGDTLDDTTVTINNFPSGFNSTTLDDGIGLLVVATSTAHTYNFHRVVAKDEDVRQLSSDINDFKARYRVGSENPTTDNDAGDLFFNTDTDKLLVRNGDNDAWEEAQSIGEFFIIPASDFPTWNGTLNDISITDNAPASAEQIVLSINGVIQEPNSGTARPTDGFSLNGSTIQLSDPPATGSEAWGVILGSTVNIGTPSANTVGPTQLIDTAVTAGSYTLSNITVDAQGRITAASSGTAADPDLITEGNTSAEVVDTGSDGHFKVTTEGTERLRIDSSGRVGIGTSSANTNLHVFSSDNFVKIKGQTNATAAGVISQYVNGNVSDDVHEIGIETSSGGSYFGGSSAYGFCMYAGGSTRSLHLGTNSSARLTINSSGNVGIGTTSPQRALVVSDAGAEGFEFYPGSSDTGNTLNHYDRGSSAYIDITTNADQHIFGRADGEKIRIDSSGRLLVGHSSSTYDSAKLQVVGTNSTSYIMMLNTTASDSDGQGYNNFHFRRRQSGGEESTSAMIHSSHDGTGDDQKGKLSFWTNDGNDGDGGSERLRISSTGAFGLSGANYGSSGQVLTSNGSGSAPSWQDAAAGGKILQVVSVAKTDKATLSSHDTWTDISGMSASITPSSSSNKIFVQVMLSHGMDSSPGDAAFKLVRGSTDIGIGDADGSARRVTVGSQTRDFDEMLNSNISFLDSPATTSETTYKIQWMIRSGTFRLNSEGSSSSANISYDRGISTITLFEVAA